MSHPKQPILTVENLQLQLASVPQTTLLKGISFEIQRGEVFALVGESGSGKSLTSLAIMRLLPEALKVTAGKVLLEGQDLLQLTEADMQHLRGNRMAMIFQEPMTALNPVMTIGDQVAEVIQIHQKLGRKAVQQRVIQLFKEVGIPNAENRLHWYPHQLSGGQKQRVMIAMALACEPELLIADEPTTALDVTIQAQVLQLLKSIQQKRSLSILFITHDMGVVAEIADRVAVMQQGQIVEMAETAHFFESPRHPYTQTLLKNALPQLEAKIEPEPKTLLAVENLKVWFPIKKGLLQRTVDYTRAVDGVSLKVQKGETLAVVGESGSGKSTLGQAILRLIPITDGCIAIEGQDITALNEKQLKPFRRRIQVIFQDPFSALNPRMTIQEIIREGMVSLKVGPQDKAWQEQRIIELLQQVGLEAEHRFRYPHEFSGGQRQRIGIARALAVEPELIICDEPTSALDVTVRAQVLQILKDLQKRYEVSYLFITHDLSIVPSLAHRVAVMQKGKIVEQGQTEQVLYQPRHPYTQTLINAAPKWVRDFYARNQKQGL
ncbi:ABC transporter ATP-binding protein [Galenea microaerophila]